MNEIIAPDFTGSDSKKINELYRYVEELRLETKAEIKGLSKIVESMAKAMKGGDIS